MSTTFISALPILVLAGVAAIAGVSLWFYVSKLDKNQKM